MKQFFLMTLTLYCNLLFASKVELEILGAGGPEIDGMASSSYILWVDNEARLIVDMGSGSLLNFEKSGAKIETLEAVVLTHLHIDHCVDLPAFVKAGYFTSRRKSLDILGPDGGVMFPSTTAYVETLFGKNGAYRYMHDVLTPQSESFEIKPYDIKKRTSREYPSFKLSFIKVPHGPVPSLALKIDIQGKIIIISGDTNNESGMLEEFAKNADLFVADHAVPETAEGHATKLHMSPSIIAKIAKTANVKKVVLTHRMNRTLRVEQRSMMIINKIYSKEILFGEDRMKLKI
ncbi:MBL fold metallo-hydrolase [Sulfurimonas aquatica]|uniref:MBL fold metallo-hydrolase n=1 Tax=Sulfurimonas aquatica TaxID=2672570 RepID=A0A975B2A4_9BACT|nr:MBL fold metallo-hydrolase [Sulfurimonas aquatica]QSZ42869.1 MBL fold metallo-hydrolase [Sulfurimonas aquatica]